MALHRRQTQIGGGHEGKEEKEREIIDAASPMRISVICQGAELG